MEKSLVRVSTYAKQKGVSPTAVRKWAAQGKVKIVEIDGVQFVKTEEKEETKC